MVWELGGDGGVVWELGGDGGVVWRGCVGVGRGGIRKMRCRERFIVLTFLNV